jgi:hypothetical protein
MCVVLIYIIDVIESQWSNKRDRQYRRQYRTSLPGVTREEIEQLNGSMLTLNHGMTMMRKSIFINVNSKTKIGVLGDTGNTLLFFFFFFPGVMHWFVD